VALLTGQRLREVGDLPWRGELDLERRIWSLPSTRTKNHRPHDVHLSDLAMEVIGKLPRFVGSDFVFSVTGEKPVQGYADIKYRIDARLAELGSVEPWTYHDLRRTCATGMADLNVAPHVLDRVLARQPQDLGCRQNL
jgi:integrase